MGHISIACYRPKPGKSDELAALTAEHVPTLRALGLASAREPIIGRAKDGTIVEVFEWISPDAVASAHTNPGVQKLWERYSAVCDYVKLADLTESDDLFAGLEPIN